MHGDFTLAHQEGIMRLARRQEALEAREHPLNRILRVTRGPRSLAIETTDLHLPRRIGEALCRAFKGRLTWHHDPDSGFVRVDWSREEEGSMRTCAPPSRPCLQAGRSTRARSRARAAA
jgi:hypothetical protein